MSITRNPNLRSNAKRLRREMTREEYKLWYNFLSGCKCFKRQFVLGEYVVDFYCPSHKLVIELDGLQHKFDKEQREKDKQRDKYLSDCDIKVLRYTNLQIKDDFEFVCEDIKKYLL